MRKGAHTVHNLKVHRVWTKYRKNVLKSDIQKRWRDFIIEIIKGVISGDHVHLHLSSSPKESVSTIMRKLKRRSGKIVIKNLSWSENKQAFKPPPKNLWTFSP